MIFYHQTNEDCVIEGRFKELSYPGIPVFYCDDGIMEAVSDYMIYKSITDTDVASSVKTYADQLQKFFRYIEAYSSDNQQLTWDKVMDRHLLEWRNGMIDEGRSPNYIRNCLETVFKFYEWAESNNYLRKHVAIYEDDNEYPISAKMGKNKSWSWPHYPKGVVVHKKTPTNDQLEALHTVAIEESDTVGLRDSLLLSIYERTARRAEALREIKVSHIPDWDEIEEFIAENKIVGIWITGKRGHRRELEFLPETMELARNYIEGDRAEAVKAAKSRNKYYEEPEVLFVGKTTGLPLTLEYMSARVSNLMQKAGIKGTGHRIRAKALTDVVAAFDGFDEKGRPYNADDVLIRGAEKAGQSNPMSLRPYLAHSRSSGLASKLNNIEYLRTVDTQCKIRKNQLAKIEKLTPLINAIIKGDGVEGELISLLEETTDWNDSDDGR